MYKRQAYGRADATRDEILEAARIANVDSFVQHLDNGYDTVLTDDGAGLSNGQRQLISIARAALANAPDLILDEATSSIDSRTCLLYTSMDKDEVYEHYARHDYYSRAVYENNPVIRRVVDTFVNGTIPNAQAEGDVYKRQTLCIICIHMIRQKILKNVSTWQMLLI